MIIQANFFWQILTQIIVKRFREDSIAKAAEAFPDAEAIFGRNIALLEKMGKSGWDALEIPQGCPFHQAEDNK